MLNRDAEAIIDAARQRLRLWDITDEQIRVIEETGKTVRTVTLVSPADGTVVQKNAVQGMRVMPGDKLFDIADLSSVWIISDIYENELPLINSGRDRADQPELTAGEGALGEDRIRLSHADRSRPGP